MSIRQQDKTHCPKGHELVGDNIYLRTDKEGYTSRNCKVCLRLASIAWKKKNFERNREIDRAKNARYRASGKVHSGHTKNVINTVTKDQVSLAIEAVRETGKIVSAHQFISADRFYALRRFNPKLGLVVNKLTMIKRPTLRLIMKPAIRFTRKLSPADLMDIVNKAVSRNLLRDQRDEIIGTMLFDLMEGRLRIEDIDTRVKQYTNRDFRDNHNKYGALSLDMKIGDGEGEFSMLDLIPETQRMWG